MLSDYIFDRRSLLRMQDVIPAARLDEFTDWLASLRYSPETIRSYAFTATRFVSWACSNGYRELSGLNRSCLIAYRREVVRLCGQTKRVRDSGNHYCGARRFVRFLRNCGVIPEEPSDVPSLVTRFCEWMRKQRGTRDSTLTTYQHVLCRLVKELGSEPRRYTAQQLRAFLLKDSATARPTQLRPQYGCFFGSLSFTANAPKDCGTPFPGWQNGANPPCPVT